MNLFAEEGLLFADGWQTVRFEFAQTGIVLFANEVDSVCKRNAVTLYPLTNYETIYEMCVGLRNVRPLEEHESAYGMCDLRNLCRLEECVSACGMCGLMNMCWLQERVSA